MEREKSALLEDILARLEVIHADLLETRKENFGRESLERVQKSRFKNIVDKTNIVISTCGDCGAVLLLQAGQEKITCHSCLEEQETKDCPDLW